MTVRPAAVAGVFYPRDPRKLKAEIARLLAAAPQTALVPKAVIVPHAGYIYSGPVAAHGFAALRVLAESVRRVVLIGPAHRVWLKGIAAPTVASFETPLGSVPLDRAAIATLAALPFVSLGDAPHAAEHALEVELPFLQTVLSAFSLVPLAVGEATAEEVAAALALLWGGAETLIVVSSDLSHDLDDKAARRRDAATAAAIERRDWRALGYDDACGARPIAGLLIEAERRDLTIRRLALANSADTAGGRSHVVGYGAWTVG